MCYLDSPTTVWAEVQEATETLATEVRRGKMCSADTGCYPRCWQLRVISIPNHHLVLIPSTTYHCPLDTAGAPASTTRDDWS